MLISQSALVLKKINNTMFKFRNYENKKFKKLKLTLKCFDYNILWLIQYSISPLWRAV